MQSKFSYAKARLRPLAESDHALTLAWRNQPEIRKWMYTTHVIDGDEHANWLRRVTTSPEYSYHIYEYDGQPYGTIGFYNMLRQHRRGNQTAYVGDLNAPRRSGRVMFFLAADFFFDSLLLDKLCSDILVSNFASCALHDRFGFTVEATWRRHVWRDGQPEDVKMYGQFAEEWRAVRSGLFEELFT